MQKIKLYLDTSAISHIEAPHKPKAEAITIAFYRFIEKHFDEYELIVSPVVDLEVDRCPEPKQSRLLVLMDRMNVVHLPEMQEALDLADRYIEQEVLASRHINDLTHVAYATITKCHFLVSWNMKHLANPLTIIRVNSVNRMYNYRDIIIATPQAITGEFPDDTV